MDIYAPPLVVGLIHGAEFILFFIYIWLDDFICNFIFIATLPISYAEEEGSFCNYWKLLIKFKHECMLILWLAQISPSPVYQTTNIIRWSSWPRGITNQVDCKAVQITLAIVWVNPGNHLNCCKPLIQTIRKKILKRNQAPKTSPPDSLKTQHNGFLSKIRDLEETTNLSSISKSGSKKQENGTIVIEISLRKLFMGFTDEIVSVCQWKKILENLMIHI